MYRLVHAGPLNLGKYVRASRGRWAYRFITGDQRDLSSRTLTGIAVQIGRMLGSGTLADGWTWEVSPTSQ